MFTAPAPAPTVSSTHTSPTGHLRPSRLRDLSATLRHYRQPHAPARGRSRNTSSPPVLSPPPASPGSHNAVTRTATAPDAPRLHRESASSASSASSAPSSSPHPPRMTRNRAETAAPQLTVRNTPGPTATAPSSSPSHTPPPAMEPPAESAADAAASTKHLPSIRLIPHQDPRPGRPSLQFPTTTRTLPDESCVIRVGRYSERDNLPEIQSNAPSAAPVGFKSKVVSRKHCELWCKDSQWYIKDVKSSSGTFLNRIRLSQPNTESKPFKIKDGDIVQLGIDFRGGEEMIFRCVKIRVECNRGWQQALNTFNKQTHQRLRNLAKKKESDTASTHTSECSICLMSIAPCQSLFVAPCSHVWHYKCIRPILNGPTWPNFLCPNCRAVADLEADVEDAGDLEEWEEAPPPEGAEGQEIGPDRALTPRPSAAPLVTAPRAPTIEGPSANGLSDLAATLSGYGLADTLLVSQFTPPNSSTPSRFITPAQSSSVTQPVTIQSRGSQGNSGLAPGFPAAMASGLSVSQGPDCPMTPRNDAGPFVLDGSAGRSSMSNHPSREGSVAPSLPPLQMD